MRVLVTRPEPGAERTAALLRARGHEAVVLPLTRTVPLAQNHDALQHIEAGAYAVTSAAALRHWQTMDIAAKQLAVPLYAVGEATGQAATQAGFRDVRTGLGNGDGLAALIARDVDNSRLNLSDAAPLLYVAGRIRRSRFEEAAKAENLPIEVVEIYNTERISYSTDYILRHFFTNNETAIFLYSHNAASILFDHLKQNSLHKQLKNSTFYCLSAHVATAVPAHCPAQIRIAAEPNEPELLALLDAPGTAQ
jgi:uroporphyrinogen-III synthase